VGGFAWRGGWVGFFFWFGVWGLGGVGWLWGFFVVFFFFGGQFHVKCSCLNNFGGRPCFPFPMMPYSNLPLRLIYLKNGQSIFFLMEVSSLEGRPFTQILQDKKFRLTPIPLLPTSNPSSSSDQRTSAHCILRTSEAPYRDPYLTKSPSPLFP